MNTNQPRPNRSGTPGPLRTSAAMIACLAVATTFMLARAMDGLAYVLVERGARDLDEARSNGLVADDRELGNVITDNLGMIVFGILAIVIIGGLISGLGTAVINWVTTQLGV